MRSKFSNSLCKSLQAKERKQEIFRLKKNLEEVEGFSLFSIFV